MSAQSYPITRIVDILKAKPMLSRPSATITQLAYDSRKLQQVQETLFFALQDRRDGHHFIPQVYQAGVRNFVVKEHTIRLSDYPDANFLYVKDPLTSLQALAAYHRMQFPGKVIGITGSNGKTIVKEWLYQLLSPDFSVVRSPKSYNSQIGVALSLWQLEPHHDFALIEAGISKAGEMVALEQMIKPHIGVLTNIKQAHRENFTSEQAHIEEKLRLFKDVQTLIYAPHALQSADRPNGSAFIWTIDSEASAEQADLQIIRSERSAKTTQIEAVYRHKKQSIEIPFNDAASIENAITCWACLLALGYTTAEIEKRMRSLAPVQMRLELKNGIHNCSVIDDSYSCDVASLVIALNFLYQQQQHANRILILSDIPEVRSHQQADVYRQIANLVKERPLTLFVGIGPILSRYSALFGPAAQFYPSTGTFLKDFPLTEVQNSTILIKGARTFAFEQISQQFVQKSHETVLEINLNALEHNVKTYKSLLAPKTKIMAMVKAFSYGNGSFEIANVLQFNQVDYLAVAYTDEGVALRKAGITLPIMVMNADIDHLYTLIQYNLEPEVFSFDILSTFSQILAEKGKIAFPVHIKIETGMNRLGFDLLELPLIVEFLQTHSQIRVASVFSHLAAAADAREDAFSRQQINQLRDFSANLRSHLDYPFITHIANTAAIARFPEARFDMVRLGIGLYGISEARTPTPLQPVATLKTVISQIKMVKPGDTVGYNRRGSLPAGGKIATVKLGYADGYDRRFGNGVGMMRIGEQVAHTVGDICMDMCMLDVSGLDVNVGDIVTIFGLEPRVEALAASIGTISYELLTGISQRVKRIYYYE